MIKVWARKGNYKVKKGIRYQNNQIKKVINDKRK
jgi:hypothetical protein